MTPDELKELYRTIFGSPDGRQVLDDLLARTSIYGVTFVADNTHETAFKEGQRSVGLFLRSTTTVDDVRELPTHTEETT